MEKHLIEIPAICIELDLVGDNSLTGAVCNYFKSKHWIKELQFIEPESVTFIIKRVHPNVNLYKEINAVRDLMNIEEEKIKVFIK